jgi:hypothetical protein
LEVDVNSGRAGLACLNRSYVLVCLFLVSLLVIRSPAGSAQTSRGKNEPVILPLPFKMEWGQSLNPWAQTKLNTDRYRFLAGSKTVQFQFSNQAPGFWGGRQFQGLPGGYQLTDFSIARKWGTIYGFQTVGHNSRMVRSEMARSITGAGVEAPKPLFGTRIAAYYLHGAPGKTGRSSYRDSMPGSAGSELGLTLARNLGKKVKIQAELVQTQQRIPFSASANEYGARRGRRNGYWARLDGTLARTEFGLTYVDRGEGLSNPAIPRYGAGNQGIWLDARRKLKRHQFQYSGSSNVQRTSPLLGLAAREVREDTIRWTYSAGRLPQISVSETWNRQASASRFEEESICRIAMDKSIRRVNAAVAMVHARHLGSQSSGIMWDRTVLSGDFNIGITKEHRFHMRYEVNGLRQHALSQRLSSNILQFDTRFALFTGRLSLAPSLDLRRQNGNLPIFDVTAARITLATQIQMPRRIPGTDLSIYFGSNSIYTAGHSVSNRTEFTVRWNFRRM